MDNVPIEVENVNQLVSSHYHPSTFFSDHKANKRRLF